jgi:2',3'-cyclic-nucleotide 2'-phosphodiesterase (5'-nucleotidase family)
MKILHTNDLHGKLDDARMRALLNARSQVDFYFDSGDAIKAGNLAIPLGIDPVWHRFQQAQLTASTMGNRESHPLKSAFEAKVKGHSHPMLVANLFDKAGQGVFPPHLILNYHGQRVGVFGVMVAMVTSKMKTQVASSYLWTNPIERAIEVARQLRPEVDSLFALTHIGFTQDQKLAESCPEIDVIFGGHSHTVLEAPIQINRSWIAQGGSHGRFLGLYEWDGETLAGGLRQWEESAD